MSTDDIVNYLAEVVFKQSESVAAAGPGKGVAKAAPPAQQSPGPGRATPGEADSPG